MRIQHKLQQLIIFQASHSQTGRHMVKSDGSGSTGLRKDSVRGIAVFFLLFLC